jgi:hypothetical protein
MRKRDRLSRPALIGGLLEFRCVSGIISDALSRVVAGASLA